MQFIQHEWRHAASMVKEKVKLSFCLTKCHAMKTYSGVEEELRVFLISALDWGKWSASRLGSLTPGERDPPRTHRTGGWVGSTRTGLDAVAKSKNITAPRGVELRSFSPYLSHYTDWATPVPSFLAYIFQHTAQATALLVPRKDKAFSRTTCRMFACRSKSYAHMWTFCNDMSSKVSPLKIPYVFPRPKHVSPLVVCLSFIDTKFHAIIWLCLLGI
jgi:hypothetical protein